MPDDQGDSDRPGREIPKEYREVIEYLLDSQGWRYDNQRKGHPVLRPGDRSKPQMVVPTTPSRSPRAFKNWLADIRQRGGKWPPPKGKQ